MTETGVAIVDRLYEAHREAVAAVFDELTPDRKATLLRSGRELSQRLSRPNPRRAVASALPSRSSTTHPRCSDWTIAQMLSHLGSQAAMFGLLLEADFGAWREATAPLSVSPRRPPWSGVGRGLAARLGLQAPC